VLTRTLNAMRHDGPNPAKHVSHFARAVRAFSADPDEANTFTRRIQKRNDGWVHYPVVKTASRLLCVVRLSGGAGEF